MKTSQQDKQRSRVGAPGIHLAHWSGGVEEATKGFLEPWEV